MNNDRAGSLFGRSKNMVKKGLLSSLVVSAVFCLGGCDQKGAANTSQEPPKPVPSTEPGDDVRCLYGIFPEGSDSVELESVEAQPSPSPTTSPKPSPTTAPKPSPTVSPVRPRPTDPVMPVTKYGFFPPDVKR